MAFHFKTRDGELVQIKAVICPTCLRLFEVAAPVPLRLTCPRCGRSSPSKHGLALATIGFDISYFGWFYGIVDPAEEEAKKEGRPPRRFRLLDPIEFLQQLALWIAAGIVGGFGYDVVKTGALRLYRRFKARKTLPRARLDEKVVKPAEAVRRLSYLHKLAEQFMRGGEQGKPLKGNSPVRTRYRVLLEIDQMA